MSESTPASTAPSAAAPAANTERKGLWGRADVLIEAMKRMSPGDIAGLFKLDVDCPNHPAFWRLLLTYLTNDNYPSTPTTNSRWAVVLSGMASTVNLHQPRVPAGAMLFSVIKEERFSRLMSAHDQQLWALFRRTIQHVNSKAPSFDWGDFADLIFSDGTEREAAVRQRIARDFYGAQLKAEAEAREK